MGRYGSASSGGFDPERQRALQRHGAAGWPFGQVDHDAIVVSGVEGHGVRQAVGRCNESMDGLPGATLFDEDTGARCVILAWVLAIEALRADAQCAVRCRPDVGGRAGVGLKAAVICDHLDRQVRCHHSSDAQVGVVQRTPGHVMDEVQAFGEWSAGLSDEPGELQPGWHGRGFEPQTRRSRVDHHVTDCRASGRARNADRDADQHAIKSRMRGPDHQRNHVLHGRRVRPLRRDCYNPSP